MYTDGKLIAVRKYYTIDNNIDFYPATGAISSSYTGKGIKLNAPTAQLLEAFISRVDVVIPQSELYSLAWGEKGVNVTPNTLYQNISLLRKALHDSGLSSETITTIRGKGFIFRAKSVVEHQVDDKNDDVKGDNTDTQQISINIEEKKQPKTLKSHITYHIKIILIFLMLLVFISIFDVYQSAQKKVKNSPINFILLSSTNGCRLFIDAADKDIINKNDINNLLHDSTLKCDKYPYIYVSHSTRHSAISIISCEFVINDNKKNNCKTEIFMNYNKSHEK